MSKTINFRGITLEFERSAPGGWTIYKRPKPLAYYAVKPGGALYGTHEGTLASVMRLVLNEVKKNA